MTPHLNSSKIFPIPSLRKSSFVKKWNQFWSSLEKPEVK